MATAAPLTIANLWKQPGVRRRGMDEQCSLPAQRNMMQAVRRRQMLTHIVTWMDLEAMALSEISQTQTDKSWKILLIRGPWCGQIHRGRKENAGCQGLGRESGGECFMGTEFRFCKMEHQWQEW